MSEPLPLDRPDRKEALSAALGALAQLLDDPPPGVAARGEDVKSCCAAVYGLDLVGVFLGDSYHPGGPALTRRLADALDLRPGQQVLDLACGPGATAMLLARERKVKVTGIDLGAVQVTKARARASQLGLGKWVQFQLGDAERLPIGDGRFDAVVCECALCTFPDKPTAAAEIARVLRPGGKVGIADIWLEPDRLEPELCGIAGRIACLADAQPLDAVHDLLTASGFEVTTTERHDQELAKMIKQTRAGLRALKIGGVSGLDRQILRRAIALAGNAADVVARGDAGYYLTVAQRTG
jgi:arsenite methyltransferase